MYERKRERERERERGGERENTDYTGYPVIIATILKIC